MNVVPADLPPPEPPTHGEGWTRRKLVFLIALAVAAHVALIFAFGTRKQIVPRAVGAVPHLQLADSADELIALADPTLFVLPHENDFVTRFWHHIPAPTPPAFGWTGSAQFLPLAEDNLGAAFREFMQTNRFAKTTLDFKPEPKLSEVTVPFESELPAATTLRVSDNLVQRPLLNQIPLPALPCNDVIAPSKVQVLVDTTGYVVSVVLLDASGYSPADQQALQLAAQLRFAPAAKVMFGEIIFNWRTVPAATTNAP